MVPGYLAFVSRISAKRQLIVTSVLFILGFSIIFVVLGASATALGALMMRWLPLFAKVAGVLLIVFGAHMIGVFKLPQPAIALSPMIVGMSFGFGWTPSIGPILAAILAMASQHDSVNRGIVLLSIYSLGLAIPFLLAALAINQLLASSKIRRHHHAIEIAAGVVMIVTGALIFTNRFPSIVL